jgi:predicted GIY-YIG superfamily endonuclease
MNRHNGLPTRRGRRRKSGSFQHWTKDLESRLQEHRAGRGARLIQVITAAGISFTVARTWQGDRRRERQIKRQGGASRICPICKARRRC